MRIFFVSLLFIFHTVNGFHASTISQDFKFEVSSRSDKSHKYVGEGKIDIPFSHLSFHSRPIEVKTPDITSVNPSHHKSYTFDGGKYFIDNNCVNHPHIPPFPTNFIEFLSKNLKKISPFKSTNVENFFDHEIVSEITRIDNETEVYELYFSGLYYVIFFNLKNSFPKKIISQHFIMTLQPLKYEFKLPPQILSSNTAECGTRRGVKHQNYKPTKAWYYNHDIICHHKWLRHLKHCGNIMAEKIEKKDCIFLHGIGVTKEEAGPPVDKWKAYWGKAEEYVTKYCKSTTFIREETLFRGWDSKDLHSAICKVMVGDDVKNGGVIKNKIIFTHSMGNLIFGGALKNGVCSFDSSTSSWYTLSPPAKGSVAAKWVASVCSQEQFGILKEIVKFFNYCYGNQTYPAYITLQVDYLHEHQVWEVIDKYSKGRLCGVSAMGLNTICGVYLKAVEGLSGLRQPDDGMVEYDSCATNDHNENYWPLYEENYYIAAVNHADSTCRDGDGWYGLDRQPCSYLSNKK